MERNVPNRASNFHEFMNFWGKKGTEEKKKKKYRNPIET